jgi:hypothetical protein
MNAFDRTGKTTSSRRVALFGAVALAIFLGATAAWVASRPTIASISVALTDDNETEHRPGPPRPPAGPPAASPAPGASPEPSSEPSPSPSATPSASPSSAPVAMPVPSASPAPGGGTPNGTAPAGWQTYGGNADVPFAIYYPAGWTVDESHAAQGRIYFYPPGLTAPTADAPWVMVETTGVRDPNANLDVLRDQYYTEQIRDVYPQSAIDLTRTNRFSGITFASVGTTYSDGGQTCYAYLGVGVKDQVPWRFRLNSPYADYDQNLDDYFNAMISSLNIYGNP